MKSKYRGVTTRGAGLWEMRIHIGKLKVRTYHGSERNAALAYDKVRIENGLAPVNILKKL